MMWHFVYLSYESKPGGRNYIGKHSTDNLYDGYLGSFSDKNFIPDSRIVLGIFRSKEAAVQAEIQWQKVFKVVPDPTFANKSYQTSSKFDTTGAKMPQEYKRKRSEKYTGGGNPNFGKTTPKHVREKISQSLTGQTFTEERREIQSKALMGNSNRKGKKDSEETNRKKSPINYPIVIQNSERIKEWWKLNKHRKVANGRTVGPTVCNHELDLKLTSLQPLKTFLDSLK